MYVHVFYAEAIVKDVAKKWTNQFGYYYKHQTRTLCTKAYNTKKYIVCIIETSFLFTLFVFCCIFSSTTLHTSCEEKKCKNVFENERKAKEINEWAWLVVVGGIERFEAYQQQNWPHSFACSWTTSQNQYT